jgi:hypothetical protein
MSRFITTLLLLSSLNPLVSGLCRLPEAAAGSWVLELSSEGACNGVTQRWPHPLPAGITPCYNIEKAISGRVLSYTLDINPGLASSENQGVVMFYGDANCKGAMIGEG